MVHVWHRKVPWELGHAQTPTALPREGRRSPSGSRNEKHNWALMCGFCEY